MVNESHVFSKENKEKTTNNQRGLPRMLEHVRDNAISVLDTLLVEMLDAADDALFDLADKAGSDTDQSLFFNAMREIRIKRKGMEKYFTQEIRNNFHQLQVIERPAKEPELQHLNVSSLSLVHEDELEENLAYDGMVGKANLHFDTDLRQIITRLDTLLANHRIDKSNNPLNPKAISESFRDATKSLALDIKVKLIILKLFDRMVISKLDSLYDAINKFLVKEGILPDLPGTQAVMNRSSHRKSRGSEDSTDTNGHAAQHSDTGADFLGALKTLLNEQKTSAGSVAGSNAAFSAQGNTPASSKIISDLAQSTTQGAISQDAGGVVAQPVNNTQLVKALSTIQVGSEKQPVSENAYFPVADLRGHLATALPITLPVSSQTIGQVNDDIIDVISLLFDFILDDNNLPDEFKILIGRLQIPVLKVAVIDDTFFSKGNHPARKLLNEMAHAGVGWTQDTETGAFSLKEKVERIVTRIIDEFDDDMTIFSESLEEFHDFIETHRNRASLLERRLGEAEEGKAKAETAKNVANDTLNNIVGDIQIPDALDKMIFDTWQSVLLLIYLREGEDSKAWKNNVEVVRTLINSLIVPSSMTLRKKLQDSIPQLQKNLKTGLDSVGYAEFDSEHFFQELEKLHARVLKGENVLVITPPENKLVAEEKSEAFYDELSIPDIDELSRELEQIENENIHQAKQADNVDPAPADTEDSQSNNVVSDNPQIPGSYFDSSLTDSGSLQEDDSNILLVESLQTGSWFELKIDDVTMRVKLAAIITSVDKYFFVNNTGKKVAEYSKPELAHEFRRENITQLDDGALFDRALKSIVSNFRVQKQYQDDGL